MPTLYHGAHTRFTPHVGLCLTDEIESAMTYGGDGELAKVRLDLRGLRVVEVEDYDRDDDIAPGGWVNRTEPPLPAPNLPSDEFENEIRRWRRRWAGSGTGKVGTCNGGVPCLKGVARLERCPGIGATNDFL